MSNRRPIKIKKSLKSNPVNAIDLIKSKQYILPPKEDDSDENGSHKQSVTLATPAKGNLFITFENPGFISGQVRLRGKGQGRYPHNYLEMINNIFGKENNVIEVCSKGVRGSKDSPCFTVDINPDTKPDLVDDGQVLQHVPDNKFDRWRCDPPYNQDTAQRMYQTPLPKTIDLLRAGARVCKVGSLLFLLLGPQNYQWCPAGVRRIGLIYASIVPNNETRCLNIYYKYADTN
jgi:hypothetical protein